MSIQQRWGFDSAMEKPSRRVLESVPVMSPIRPWRGWVEKSWSRPRRRLQFDHNEAELESLLLGHNGIADSVITKLKFWFGHDDGESDRCRFGCNKLFVRPWWSWSLRLLSHKEKTTQPTVLGAVKSAEGGCFSSLLLSLPTRKSGDLLPSTWFHRVGRVGASPLSTLLNREERRGGSPPFYLVLPSRKGGSGAPSIQFYLVERRGGSPSPYLVLLRERVGMSPPSIRFYRVRGWGLLPPLFNFTQWVVWKPTRSRAMAKPFDSLVTIKGERSRIFIIV